MMKRAFDILFSAMGLTLLAVPLALVAVAIKCSSRGPVLYRQRRIGRGGHPFWLYKFRTMHHGGRGSLITVEGDQRITGLGRVLRRWKIDELPQLWNVLRGELSVVGPRPEVEQFLGCYTPEQRRLLQQTPGLASLSQLVYPHEAEMLRNCSRPEEFYIQQLMPRKIEVDLEYEDRRTFWSDMRLLAEIGLLILGKSFRRDRNFRITSV